MKLLIITTVLVLTLFIGCIESPEPELDFDVSKNQQLTKEPDTLCDLNGIRLDVKINRGDSVVVDAPGLIRLINGDICTTINKANSITLYYGSEVGESKDKLYDKTAKTYRTRYSCLQQEKIEDGIIVQKERTYIMRLLLTELGETKNYIKPDGTSTVIVIKKAECEETQY